MGDRPVVLLSSQSLLTAGVERLLQGVDGLKLSVVNARDAEALPKLRQLAPEVIELDRVGLDARSNPRARSLPS